MNELREFSNNEQLVNELSTRIMERLEDDIKQKGSALLAVSGGSSPKALFARLRNRPLAWEKITIVLVDERWVSPSHVDSNEAMVKQFLMQENASQANFIGWSSSAESIEGAVNEANVFFEKLVLPFSAIVLGMGTDGHTASWFADAPEYEFLIDSTQEPAVSSAKPKTAPHTRLTLNYSAVMQTQALFLQINGLEKKNTLEKAFENNSEYIYPISNLLLESSPLEIFWSAT